MSATTRIEDSANRFHAVAPPRAAAESSAPSLTAAVSFGVTMYAFAATVGLASPTISVLYALAVSVPLSTIPTLNALHGLPEPLRKHLWLLAINVSLALAIAMATGPLLT